MGSKYEAAPTIGQSRGDVDPVSGEASVRVLVADDDHEEVRRIYDLLSAAQSPSFEIVLAEELEGAARHLRSAEINVVLLGLSVHEGDARAVDARAQIGAASVPILVIADAGDEDKTLRAVREGAQDYLIRGQFDRRTLVRAIRHAIERCRLTADLSQAREREHYAATHDLLTGLSNRHALHDHLSQALAYADRYSNRLALLFLDLDRFKAINDTVGHSAGDRILRGIAERLAGATRGGDFVARVGGDEFVVVTTSSSSAEHDPAKVSERLLASIMCPFGVESTQFMLTACIGIAVYPGDGRDPIELVQNADLALHHAKKLGRGQFHFYSEDMNEAARTRLELERGLRKALDQDHLYIEFQAQVDPVARRVVAAEALVRWQHPEKGRVGPDQFIPIAEEVGLIGPIGEWVLRAACTQGKNWRNTQGEPLRIAVNVSARQLTDENFPDKVAFILHQAGLEPDRLELEITESTLMHHAGAAVIAFSRLREMGVRMSIDDFGTGYSSLSALRQLPVSALKIDRMFVRDLATNEADQKITAAAVALAKGLGLETVAEGVEEVEQMEFLVSCGCDLIQGFLYSKPIPANEFEAWLRNPDFPTR
ncbi:MAG: EAL domain-containing protein [Myxococcota bacterium]